MGSTPHLRGTSGLLLHLLDALSHLLYRLLEFLIFRGNAPEISEPFSHKLPHFFPGLWCHEQGNAQSHQYPIGKFTQISYPFVKYLAKKHLQMPPVTRMAGRKKIQAME
jgi:hypothetical protein